MSKATLCDTCGIDLATVETAFAAEGYLYCSRTCGILRYSNDEDAFDAVAEEVSTASIGLRGGEAT